MTKRINLKVGVSGIRGIIGEYLTPALATDFAVAFGEYVGGGRVIIGRDTRNTGQMLENAVIAGLLSVGCQPVLLGVVPTPTVLMTVARLHANGGIVITASHNPVEWNALKFASSSGVFLNETETAELLDIYNQPEREYVKEQDYRNIRILENAFDAHKTKIFSKIKLDSIRKARFKVAVDCCNGVGAIYSKKFLEELGCDVFPVFDQPDGQFRRSPEPIPENLTELSKIVKKNNCVLGFAQDPDGDRIAIVNSNGKPIGEHYSLVLCAEHILSRTPGNVVANIQTTKALEDVAKKYKCKVFYSKVGEINVINEIFATDSVVGGEGNSGGVIWPALHPARDSFTAMALVLEMLALRSQILDEIMAGIPQYYTKNLKIECSTSKAWKIIKNLSAKFAKHHPITLDGIRLNWKDSWVLIRPSNTEPVIRITSEAQTPEKAEELAAKFADEINISEFRS